VKRITWLDQAAFLAFAALWWFFTLARGCGPLRPTEQVPAGQEVR